MWRLWRWLVRPQYRYSIVVGTSHASAEEAARDAQLKVNAQAGEAIGIAAARSVATVDESVAAKPRLKKEEWRLASSKPSAPPLSGMYMSCCGIDPTSGVKHGPKARTESTDQNEAPDERAQDSYLAPLLARVSPGNRGNSPRLT